MNITSIKEALVSLAQSLQISTIFPASLLVLINFYFILPFWMPVDWDSPAILSLVVAVSLIASYMLYAFNFAIIRFFEGYKLKSSIPSLIGLWWHRHLYSQLTDRIELLTGELDAMRFAFKGNPDDDMSILPLELRSYWLKLKSELADCYRRQDIAWPADPKQLLPTKLGNTVRAFEDYPRTRYGMDSVALWPRLVPLLKRSNYLNFVMQEKAVFDLLLNTLLVVIVLTVELFLRAVFFLSIQGIVIVVGGSIIVCWLLWEGLDIAARQWGTTVRVAFDLYRYQLQIELGLKSTDSFDADFKLWTTVSQFFLYRQTERKLQGFEPSRVIFERIMASGEEMQKHQHQAKSKPQTGTGESS